jgi:hypothetical protein
MHKHDSLNSYKYMSEARTSVYLNEPIKKIKTIQLFDKRERETFNFFLLLFFFACFVLIFLLLVFLMFCLVFTIFRGKIPDQIVFFFNLFIPSYFCNAQPS